MMLKLSSNAGNETMPVSPGPGLEDVLLRPIHGRNYSENSLGDQEYLLPP